MEQLKVLLPQPIAQAGVDVLERANIEVVHLEDCESNSIASAAGGCQAILVRTARLSAELLSNAQHLRVVSRHGVGTENIDLDYCRAAGIRVTYAPESNTVSVAEHAIGLMCAVAKRVRIADHAARSLDFEARNRIVNVELDHKTLGIVGYGRIGRMVAKKAEEAFNMNVLAYDPFANQSGGLNTTRVVDFATLLSSADVVSLHVPLTSETRGLFGSNEFRLMRPDSIFINCSRGGVVDELALLEALRSDKLYGAGVDVFADEPITKDNLLLDIENTVLTPHMAAHTAEGLERMAVHAAEGIVDVLFGREPTWSVV